GALGQGPHHPTLVAFGDVETTPYLVMEYIDGVRLNDWIGRVPIAPEEIARLGAAVALALDDLHRLGIAHLDLNPTNVLYRPRAERRQRLYRDPVPPRALVASTPEWLQEIILRCLEIDARDRYATGSEVAFDLTNPDEVAQTERSVRERRAGWVTRIRQRVRA